MITRFTRFLTLALIGVVLSAHADEPVGGLLRVYSDQLQGRLTASGEFYEVSALTAAHASLPLGTMVRVANFETGRMVDVRINDRKRSDSTLIHLSRAAARHIGLSAERAARGSMMVIGMMPPLSTSVIQEQPGPLPVPTSTDAPAQKRFAPFQASKKDPLLDAVNEPGNAARLAGNEEQAVQTGKRGLFGRKKDVQYGIPAEQYAPPAMAHNTTNRSVGGRGELVPLSAGARLPARLPARAAPAPVPVPVPVPPRSSSSVAVAPYRVQFGAFRRGSNASEMNEALLRSGIGTTVIQSSANALYLVVTSGGFRTAEEAQRWIHSEGTRRGWRERPVVIR